MPSSTLYEHEREDQIFLHVKMASWNRGLGKATKFVYHPRRAREDMYMRVLSHLERHGPTPFHVIFNIMETTDGQARKRLSEMLDYRLINEDRHISEKTWRGDPIPRSTYKMNRKGRLYLTKMRALWNLIDGKQKTQPESV